MNAIARAVLSTVVFTILASTELAQLAGASARCRIVGSHDGHWDYKVTSGEWLCRCIHCDRALGRFRP